MVRQTTINLGESEAIVRLTFMCLSWVKRLVESAESMPLDRLSQLDENTIRRLDYWRSCEE